MCYDIQMVPFNKGVGELNFKCENWSKVRTVIRCFDNSANVFDYATIWKFTKKGVENRTPS